MADVGWGQLFFSALAGGVTVKLLDIAYKEFARHLSRSSSATEFVDTHLDPLLKATDELCGKLRALAEGDFHAIAGVTPDENSFMHTEFAGVAFLFARFWAQVEVIRRDGITISMSRDKRGKQLQAFLDCLESRRIRIIPRVLQRAIGEVLLSRGVAASFINFVADFENDPLLRRWLMPLVEFLSKTTNTSERQRLLQHTVIMHALIDTLDPNHSVTRNRPALPSKLTKRSWRDLDYRVFAVYLKFVVNRRKYLGPPKRRP